MMRMRMTKSTGFITMNVIMINIDDDFDDGHGRNCDIYHHISLADGYTNVHHYADGKK